VLTREEALAIDHAGPETVVRVLLEMDVHIHTLEQRVEEGQAQILHLQNQLAQTSHNSSQPPSTDGFRKPAPKSLREKSARPSGGQPGHAGHTLTMADKPDQIVPHRVDRCERCHRSLADRPPEHMEKRQVHDLPPKRLIVIEHQAETTRCPCGYLNKASFPEGVNAPVQYGPGLKATAVYLNIYQFLPYERACDLLGNLFGCQISEGTLANILRECHERLELPVQQIKEQVTQAPVAHFDESGVRVERTLWWLHTASTVNATYYDIHRKRGVEALDTIGILPDYLGRAIHDCWKPYFGYACAHGLCNAHHLRELVFVHEQHHQPWGQAMINCLLDIKQAVAQARPTVDHLTPAQLCAFEARYQNLLDEGYVANPLPASPAPAEKKRGRRKKTKPRNLLERLDHHRQEVLAFMYDFNVPFDNNLAERDIRMMKVQQKISGLFRSEEGAKAFCRIRSYLSTARKNGWRILDALTAALQHQPFRPRAPTLDAV